jgi:hypothetical protein
MVFEEVVQWEAIRRSTGDPKSIEQNGNCEKNGNIQT